MKFILLRYILYKLYYYNHCYCTLILIPRNLHHLESPGDPAWECLSAQHSYILQLLFSVQSSHLNREMADHDLGSGAAGVVGGPGGGSTRHTTPAAKYNKIMMSSVGEWQVGSIYVVFSAHLSLHNHLKLKDALRLVQYVYL